MHFKVRLESSLGVVFGKMTYFNPFLSVPRWISSCGGKGLSRSGITSPSTLSSPRVVANADVIDFHLLLFSSPLLDVLLLFLLFVVESDNSPPIPPEGLPQNTSPFLFLKCFGALRVDAMNPLLLEEEETSAPPPSPLLLFVNATMDDDEDCVFLLRDDDDDDDSAPALLETF